MKCKQKKHSTTRLFIFVGFLYHKDQKTWSVFVFR